MGKAKKRGGGGYRARAYVGVVNGKKKYVSFTAPTKKEAEYLAAQFVMKRKAVEIPENMMLSEAFDRYIEDT